jgi:hypothetical protein
MQESVSVLQTEVDSLKEQTTEYQQQNKKLYDQLEQQQLQLDTGTLMSMHACNTTAKPRFICSYQ